MNDIIWEPPPQAALDAQVINRSQYGELAIALRDRKGEWARVDKTYATDSSAKNTAQNMRRGVVKGFTKGEYEVLCHERQIWVRYTGPQGGSESTQPAPRRAEKSAEPDPERAGSDPGDDDGSADDNDRAFPARVRAWAKLHGHENISERGRLPQALIEEYEKDTQDYRSPTSLQVVRS